MGALSEPRSKAERRAESLQRRQARRPSSPRKPDPATFVPALIERLSQAGEQQQSTTPALDSKIPAAYRVVIDRSLLEVTVPLDPAAGDRSWRIVPHKVVTHADEARRYQVPEVKGFEVRTSPVWPAGVAPFMVDPDLVDEGHARDIQSERAAMRQHLANEAAYGPTVAVVVRFEEMKMAGGFTWTETRDVVVRGRLSAIHRHYPDHMTVEAWQLAGVVVPRGTLPPARMERA